MNNASDVPYKKSGSRWVNKDGKKVPLVPVQFTIIYTGSEFQSTTIGETTLTAGNYYYYNGRDAVSNIAIWELTDNETALAHSEIPIFNIMEGTYTGKDMGERSITAQIDFPSRIDFQIGDFVKFDIANLLRANGVAGGHGEEKFYIYTMPTVKKVARAQSFGKAFQHTVTFYPCQYELATVKMRDVLQEVSSGVIYTGYDEFSFYGGANTLMKRIIAVLNERFGNTGVPGKDYWSYQIADSINEDKNTALEKFQFDFSDSSVMDALLKLNDAEGVNTKFFINERMIYVGYKRPYITGVDSNNIQRSVPFEFMYGKTSHMPIETNYGNLFTLTKSNGSASPITRLYAYGADRNLHRFYCSDRIKTGRYVNKLMLPSFEDDGRTDYIDSPEGIARFGIREGTKNFENIYPSLRFFYYGNLRDVKYCIKLMGSGLESDSDGVYDGGTSIAKASLTSEQIERAKSEVDRAKYDGITNTAKVVITVGGQDYTLTVAEADQLINKGTVHLNGKSGGVYNYPIARVQCYRVEELTKIVDGATVHTGLNRLVESAPPVDLAVFCHATGKVVKVVLYADKNGQTSIQRQLAADGKIPTRTLNGTDYIVGSCFAVHDANFGCGHIDAANTYPGRPNGNLREAWFQDADTISTDRDGTYDKDYEIYKNQVSIHQIHYTDDHWITDVYEFESYNQERFNRQGYSAYCWPRVNKHYPESQSDNIEVNAVVDVGPVLIEDTDLNTSEGKQQQTFDIYLRDVGFKINEQTWFGDRVFLFDTCKINFLDGNLAGYEFEMPAESDQAQLGSIYVPALKPDGSRNDEFFDLADNPSQAEQAYLKGAFWRIVAKRAETDVDRYWVPNVMLNANAGDHIVFLDIFMPDIYVRVAEQRLLKEAKKYLDANDDGDIQYSFDLDKVRPNEQPIFALQMREGAIMRVVDDDLDIGTVNGSKTLFDDKNGLVSMESMQKYDVSVETNYEVVERTREDLESTQGTRITYDGTNHEYYLFFDTLLGDANKDMYYEDGLTIYWVGSGISFKTKADNILGVEHTGSGTTAAQHKLRLKNIDFLKGYEYAVEHWDWKVQYCFEQTILTPQIDQTILPSGVRRYCAANNLTEFEAGKYYEVVIDTMEDSLAVHDGAVPRFALVNGLGDGQTIYNPEYTTENMTPSGASYKRYKYKFTLPDEFNDNEDYYPAILYASNGQNDVVHVRLMSIIEQDGERLGNINYVDLSIDTVTIKFHDNTREARVSLQEGQEPERLTTNQTEMVRTVTATVKEESRATAWAQLMDRVADAEQLQDQTLDFYQNLVIAARRHYIELLNLRNNIFDPDGTCKETFLQIMMLQVGADSMNYQLKYTHYSMNGHTANCGLRFDTDHPTTEITDPVSGEVYIDSFFIGNAEEVLDHYVYTDHPSSGEGGRWYPQERNQQWKLHKILPEGQTTDIYPVYFIALKASLTDPRDCHWVCEPTQHATNELVNGSTGYFYFNWGILAPESESVGKYTLTETRGNAYMYGDNLICGQISTLAGNSYFDLTHGNFVLAKDAGSPALSYINGVLTISGINDGSENSILVRLGLTEGVANGAASAATAAAAAAAAAAQAAATAQAAVDNVTNDGIISKGTEKQELNREFIIIAGTNRDGEGTDGSYYKNKVQADEYGVDHSALDQAFADLYAAMKDVLGTNSSTGKIDGSKMQIDTYIGGLINNVPIYQIQIPFGANLYTGNDPLTVTSATNVFTGIQTESSKRYKIKIDTVSGNARVLDAIYSADGSVETFTTIVSAESGGGTFTDQSAVIVGNGNTLGFRCGADGSDQSWELTGINIRKYAEIGPTEFNALWKNYYDAEVELLNRISNAIDEKEIGGENLCIFDGGRYDYENTFESGGYVNNSYIELFQTAINPQGGGTIRTYVPAGKYVFSAKEVYGAVTRSGGIPVSGVTFELQGIGQNGANTLYWKYISGENVKELITVNEPCSFRIRVAYGYSQGNSVLIRLVDVMLQRGTKPTHYQDYVKHLTDALHGSTEIAGGITMTNLLLLKDEEGKVKAGMSGLTDNSTESGSESEGVAMFAGGDYEEALAQAQAAAQNTLDQLSKLLPILLTKTGYGSRIGCFNVEDENTVYIENESKTEKITFDTDLGITISKRANKYASYVDKIRIHAGVISNDVVSSNQINGGKISLGSYIEQSPYVLNPPNMSGALSLDTSHSYYSVTNSLTAIKVEFLDYWNRSESHVTAVSWRILGIRVGLQRVSDGRFYQLGYKNGVQASAPVQTAYTTSLTLSTLTKIPSGEYKLVVKFDSATGWSGPNYTGDEYNLLTQRSVTGVVSVTLEGQMLFSSQLEDTITEIASNGMMISSPHGVAQILNSDSNNLFVVMSGLPHSASKGGQLYQDNGIIKVNLGAS